MLATVGCIKISRFDTRSDYERGLHGEHSVRQRAK
jgi:hypothetical protein